jgi:hypothetical protein
LGLNYSNFGWKNVVQGQKSSSFEWNNEVVFCWRRKKTDRPECVYVLACKPLLGNGSYTGHFRGDVTQ